MFDLVDIVNVLTGMASGLVGYGDVELTKKYWLAE